jgi:hypothetical protein
MARVKHTILRQSPLPADTMNPDIKSILTLPVLGWRFPFIALAALPVLFAFISRASAADYSAQDLHTLKLPAEIACLAFAPDSKSLAVVHSTRMGGGIYKSTVTFWNMDSGKQSSSMDTDLDATAIAFADDGKSIVLVGGIKEGDKWDCRLAVFDVSKRELTRTVQVPGIAYAAVSSDGKLAALLSCDKEHPAVDLWDPSAGKRVARLTTTADPTLISFSANGKFLAAGRQGELRAWDVTSRKEIATLPMPPKDRLYALSIASDGKTLVAGVGIRRPLQLFELEKGTLKGDCEAWSDYNYALAASPDGNLLASTYFDQLYLITTDTWQSRFSCETNQARKDQRILFSPDSHIVATTSEDQTVRLFKVIIKK